MLEIRLIKSHEITWNLVLQKLPGLVYLMNILRSYLNERSLKIPEHRDNGALTHD